MSALSVLQARAQHACDASNEQATSKGDETRPVSMVVMVVMVVRKSPRSNRTLPKPNTMRGAATSRHQHRLDNLLPAVGDRRPCCRKPRQRRFFLALGLLCIYGHSRGFLLVGEQLWFEARAKSQWPAQDSLLKGLQRRRRPAPPLARSPRLASSKYRRLDKQLAAKHLVSIVLLLVDQIR